MQKALLIGSDVTLRLHVEMNSGGTNSGPTRINSHFWPICLNSCSLPKTRVYMNKQGCKIANFSENLSRNWLLKIWTLQSGNPENKFFVPKWSLWLGNFTNSYKFAINILNSLKFASNIYNSLKFAHWNCQFVFGSCSLPKNPTRFVFAFFWFVPPLVGMESSLGSARKLEGSKPFLPGSKGSLKPF